MRAAGSIVFAALALAGCATAPSTDRTAVALAPAARANPLNWPAAASPGAISDPAAEAAIDALLARMSLSQKVGQLVQADIGSISPGDLETYPLGSLLAGGNSGPYGNERATAAEWDRMVRAYRAASLKPAANGVAIPILFGVDAVHGHNNIPGATIFPHNIGLGAANDPELIRRIGRATAAEVAGSGIEWTFAPTLAVPQDARWGRTYEGYSSDPALVASYSREMVLGLQGDLKPGVTVGRGHVAATAKHFLADGGTERGQDQADARISEQELVAVHAAGYPAAIDAGALTVMVSFSSWNGVKNHGNSTLLTDVLKKRMGFAGLVVGDWNGHGQVAGCTATDCPQALLAGLDLYMAPDSWKGLYQSLLGQAASGAIPSSRLDDAVRRILRVKHKLGLMDSTPYDRGDHAAVGAPAHLAIAREAVAKSLVLLKNSGSILPIKPGASVLVAGAGADSMAMQAGGWTVSWQGTDVTRADFPNGQTIWEGIRAAVMQAGGTAALSIDGGFAGRPDVAIVVYGEAPYAEFQGDVAHLDYQPGNPTDLTLIEKLKAQGIPVVSVFLSGRPMFVGPEMAASDAFVAAWLPGSQGAGIADVMIAGKTGTAPRPFTGTLSYDWPAGCEPGAPTLFPRGFGGTYTRAPPVPPLNTTCALGAADTADAVAIYARGLAAGIEATSGGRSFVNLTGSAANLKLSGFDVAAQEDARRIGWSGPARLDFRWSPRALPDGAAVEMRYRTDVTPTAAMAIQALGEAPGSENRPPLDLTPTLALAAGKGWRTMQVPVRCLSTGSLGGITLISQGAFEFDIETLRVIRQAADIDCAGPF